MDEVRTFIPGMDNDSSILSSLHLRRISVDLFKTASKWNAEITLLEFITMETETRDVTSGKDGRSGKIQSDLPRRGLLFACPARCPGRENK